jgi:DNA-binding NtrC family response regulator
VETSLSRCRLIFASNVDLQSQVQAGRFRSDLYFRINVLELQLQPLRERRRDIPLIAVDCLVALAPELGITDAKLTLKMLHALTEYDWPGNIRELRNRLLRALTLREGTEIRLQHLGLPKPNSGIVSSGSGLGRGAKSLTGQVAEASREAIVTCIRAHGNRKAAAARSLKISRSTLYRKMREYGIQEQELVAEVSTR